LHISRLRIRNFRNFRSAEFQFAKGVNTLIGENGSGKTNAFQAIRLLLDDSLSRGAGRLRESDFSRALTGWRGHWVVISLEFEELDASEGCQVIRHHTGHMDGDQRGTYTYIFRPNKSVRKSLHDLSRRDGVTPDELHTALSEITIDQYEAVLTGRGTANFLDDAVYATLVADFATGTFPDPDADNAELLGDKMMQPLHCEVSCTFVKALRDVVADLKNFRDSPLLNLLRGTERQINAADTSRIIGKITELNQDISTLVEIRQIALGVQGSLHDTAGHTYSPSIDIRSGIPEELDRLLQRLCLVVSDPGDDGYKGELEELSLGGANLIYLSLKLLEYEMKTATSRVSHFLLIEEPESHIHTHIQKTLFDKYNYENTQVVVSTHSTHISASSKVRSVNILAKSQREAIVFHPANGLDGIQCQRIERYLDAVRSTLLFAKGVILVEGDAELILIPTLVKAIFGIGLDEFGVSLISMSAAVFSNISNLFHDDRIRRNCAIITDRDKSILEPLADHTTNTVQAQCRASEVSGEQRKIALEAATAGNSWVRLFFATHTFEVDLLMAGNSDLVISALLNIYVQPGSIEESKKKLVSAKVAIAGLEMLRLAEKEGKGWFAVLLSEKVTATATIPSYILSAIAFAARSGIDRRTICQMARYRCEKVHAGHAATANIEGLIERNDLAGLQTAYMTQFPDDALSLFINLLNPNG